jgi:hypothetical protein
MKLPYLYISNTNQKKEARILKPWFKYTTDYKNIQITKKF